jgi:transposase
MHEGMGRLGTARPLRAAAAGFRMVAPKRGEARTPGTGLIRNAIERGHNRLAQCGRIARRLDRLAQRYRAGIECACVLIFLRRGFVR